MLDDRDIFKVMMRYHGLPVTVQTHGLGRVFGILSGVHVDCVRLTNTMQTHEADDGRWFGEMARAALEDAATGKPETVIPFHQLVTVTCEDDYFQFREDMELPVSSAETLTESETIVTDEPSEDTSTIFVTDRVELKFGAGLMGMMNHDDDLKDRVRRVRRDLMEVKGIRLPQVRLRSDLDVGSLEYRIVLNGVEAGRGTLRNDRLLAIVPESDVEGTIEGEETTEPVFGLPSCWIEHDQRKDAEVQGYTVVEPRAVVVTHLSDICKRRCHELLPHETVHQMLQELRADSYALVDENFPGRIATHTLHRLICELMREGVNVGCFAKIVEALVWHYHPKHTFDALFELVRRELGRQIVAGLVDHSRMVRVITLTDPQARLLKSTDAGDLSEVMAAAELTSTLANRLATPDGPVAVVVPGDVRRSFFHRINSVTNSSATVLNFEELTLLRDAQERFEIECLLDDGKFHSSALSAG